MDASSFASCFFLSHHQLTCSKSLHLHFAGSPCPSSMGLQKPKKLQVLFVRSIRRYGCKEAEFKEIRNQELGSQFTRWIACAPAGRPVDWRIDWRILHGRAPLLAVCAPFHWIPSDGVPHMHQASIGEVSEIQTRWMCAESNLDSALSSRSSEGWAPVPNEHATLSNGHGSQQSLPQSIAATIQVLAYC